MTVPQLRAECKRLGLPAYQHKGKRLRKADLIKQIERAGNDASTSRKVLVPNVGRSRTMASGTRSARSMGKPAVAKRNPKRLVRDETVNQLIATLAAMPTTPAEAMALYRMLNGTATAKHNGILRRREGRAYQRLRDRAATEGEWQKWHERYLRSTGTC